MKIAGYNKRNVMRSAWEIKKGRNGWMYTFAECLRYAWKEAKRQVKRANEWYERQYGSWKPIEVPTQTLSIMVDPYKNNRDYYYTGD